MSYLPKTEAARVHNSVFHDWGTGDSEYVRAEDCNSIEQECDQLRARVAELEKAMATALDLIPEPNCCELYHKKKEQHELGLICPVEIRLKKTMEQIRSLTKGGSK